MTYAFIHMGNFLLLLLLFLRPSIHLSGLFLLIWLLTFLTSSGHFWPFLAFLVIFGHLGHFWPFLTNFCNFWRLFVFLALYGHFGPFSAFLG